MLRVWEIVGTMSLISAGNAAPVMHHVRRVCLTQKPAIATTGLVKIKTFNPIRIVFVLHFKIFCFINILKFIIIIIKYPLQLDHLDSTSKIYLKTIFFQ